PFAGVRVSPTTVCPRRISSGIRRRPTAPVAPATKIRIVSPHARSALTQTKARSGPHGLHATCFLSAPTPGWPAPTAFDGNGTVARQPTTSDLLELGNNLIKPSPDT